MKSQKTYFAAVGDVHGHFTKFIRMLQSWEVSSKKKLDFVLQVGDLEPHRNQEDLSSMAAPSKYRHLGDYQAYHNGEKSFPWPIYFIGGNHEPYGFLDQNTNGFELTRNLTYIGRAASRQINNISIAGLSGIFDKNSLNKPRPSIRDITKTSNKEYIYFKEHEVETLMKASSVDILLFHEWPLGIIHNLHLDDFERQRRNLRYENIGNEYAYLLIEYLTPKLVLCGHMHKRYSNSLNIDGKDIKIECLASVHEEEDVFEIFEIDQNSNIKKYN